MTIVGPSDSGNVQRRAALATQLSTAWSPIVELVTLDELTVPPGAIDQALLVAEAHLVRVPTDHATHRLPRQRTTRVGLTAVAARHRALSTSESTYARAITRSESGSLETRAMPEGAHRAVADRAEAGATAAATDPLKTQPSEAEVVADLIPRHRTERAQRIGARDRAHQKRRRRDAACHLLCEHAEDAERRGARLRARGHPRVFTASVAFDRVAVAASIRGRRAHRAGLARVTLTAASLLLPDPSPLVRSLGCDEHARERWMRLGQQVDRQRGRSGRHEEEDHEEGAVERERGQGPPLALPRAVAAPARGHIGDPLRGLGLCHRHVHARSDSVARERFRGRPHLASASVEASVRERRARARCVERACPSCVLSAIGWVTSVAPSSVAGNVQRRTVLATHCSTLGLPSVELETDDACTRPVCETMKRTVISPSSSRCSTRPCA